MCEILDRDTITLYKKRVCHIVIEEISIPVELRTVKEPSLPMELPLSDSMHLKEHIAVAEPYAGFRILKIMKRVENICQGIKLGAVQSPSRAIIQKTYLGR